MAERNEKVLDRVRQELSKNKKLGSRELYEMAQGWDASIGKETLQQFHARYVLPIKREDAARTKGRGRRRAATSVQAGGAGDAASKPREGRRARTGRPAVGAADRDHVRSVLLEFARDFADAESRPEIVQVLSRVDEYVDKIAPNGQ